MKVLKNQGQVLQIINRKLNELRKKFDEADGEEAMELNIPWDGASLEEKKALKR